MTLTQTCRRCFILLSPSSTPKEAVSFLPESCRPCALSPPQQPPQFPPQIRHLPFPLPDSSVLSWNALAWPQQPGERSLLLSAGFLSAPPPPHLHGGTRPAGTLSQGHQLPVNHQSQVPFLLSHLLETWLPHSQGLQLSLVPLSPQPPLSLLAQHGPEVSALHHSWSLRSPPALTASPDGAGTLVLSPLVLSLHSCDLNW